MGSFPACRMFYGYNSASLVRTHSADRDIIAFDLPACFGSFVFIK
jgi:hypothetical protein